MNDQQLQTLLCSTFPLPQSQNASRDLWPSLAHRLAEPFTLSRSDLLVAAGVVVGAVAALTVIPRALFLLACL